MKTYQSCLIGDLVNTDSVHREGLVLNIFKHVSNIKLSNQQGFSLIDDSVLMAPHHIRINGERYPNFSIGDLKLESGMTVKVMDDNIIISDRGIINLSSAREWNSKLPPVSIEEKIEERVSKLVDYLINNGRNEGLGELNKYWDDLYDLKKNPFFSGLLLERGFNLLKGLISGGDFEYLSDIITKMLGLGPGLTPSGDDFLVGWLSVISISDHCSKISEMLIKSLKEVDLFSLTTFISALQIKGALGGSFNEYIINFYNNFSAEEKDFFNIVDNLIRVGSTSGTDMMTGIIFGFFIDYLQ